MSSDLKRESDICSEVRYWVDKLRRFISDNYAEGDLIEQDAVNIATIIDAIVIGNTYFRKYCYTELVEKTEVEKYEAKAYPVETVIVKEKEIPEKKKVVKKIIKSKPKPESIEVEEKEIELEPEETEELTEELEKE